MPAMAASRRDGIADLCRVSNNRHGVVTCRQNTPSVDPVDDCQGYIQVPIDHKPTRRLRQNEQGHCEQQAEIFKAAWLGL